MKTEDIPLMVLSHYISMLKKEKCSWAYAAEQMGVDLWEMREYLAKKYNLKQRLYCNINECFLTDEMKENVRKYNG